MWSLRARIVTASIVWTAGLLVTMHLAFVLLAHRFPMVLRLNLHSFVVGAVALLGVGFLLVRGALSRFDELRARLAELREGVTGRVEGAYPSEVQPLVNELNALLEQREEAVRRALAKAGDLAHGLKTPLAILAQEAESARRSGRVELAVAIEQQVERMRRQIEVHLAQTRTAGSGATPGTRVSVHEAAEALARTLRRLHAERGVVIAVNVPEGHSVRVERTDLDEMLGNLLDNGCKWARSRVTIASEVHGGSIAILVDDDGSGLEPSMREAVLQRGVRADEAAPGSGLGLAIVRQLAELSGGSIDLDGSPDGGVRARLLLPGADEGTKPKSKPES